MLNALNNGTIIGNISRESKVFTNDNGLKVILITVGTRYKTKDGYQSNFITLKQYTKSDKQAEFVASMTKGRLVSIDYHLYNRSTKDEQGDWHSDLQAIVDNIMPLETIETQNLRSNAQANRKQATGTAQKASTPLNNLMNIKDEDLPF